MCYQSQSEQVIQFLKQICKLLIKNNARLHQIVKTNVILIHGSGVYLSSLNKRLRHRVYLADFWDEREMREI